VAALPVLPGTSLDGSPATLIGPFTPMPDAPAPGAAPGPPTTLLGPVPPMAGPPTLPSTVSILPTQPANPPPVIGVRTPGSPFAGSLVASTPFTVPPWQSGQPGGPPTERAERSWAVIDLPAFDPEVFERHRRIVLRVAGGLVGLILLLAIVAGRC
jgi:hypothetical protein